MCRCTVYSLLFFIGIISTPAIAAELCITRTGSQTELSLCGGDPCHRTEAEVADARIITVTDSTVHLILWNERSASGEFVPYYAISPDGAQVGEVRKTSYDIRLEYTIFDPATQSVSVDTRLTADTSNRLYIVQFVTHPLGVFRRGVANLGGRIRSFVSNHGHVVEMTASVKTQVEALPKSSLSPPHQY